MLARAKAQRVYGAARESHNERTTNTLKHSTCSHKWWKTLKGSIYGVNPSIPALRGPGGGLVVAPAEKASLLGSQFDNKLCREQFVTPLSCFSQSECNSSAFRISVLLRLLLDHDTYRGVDPLDVFPLFLKKVADIICQKLSIIFRKLIRLGSFPECLRSANETAIPKGTASTETEITSGWGISPQPISIAPILSMVYEKLVSYKLSSFCEKHGLLPAAQFAYRKGLGCTDALLTISHHLQTSLDAVMESYIVQLDFSAVFDRGSHSGLLFI